MPKPPTSVSRPLKSPRKHLEVKRHVPVTLFKYFKVDSLITVGAVFSSVAKNYDTMNDLMSFYIHRLWKDRFVRSINPGVRQPSSPSFSASTEAPGSSTAPEAQRILDIAGGTGDIALRLLDHATLINNDQNTSVVISDINPEMLAEGRKRMAQTAYANTDRISYLEANAEDLSAIESSSIDLYTVAFGIRNFTSIPNTLREAYRVLKPGGVFACLEFSKVGNPLLNAVYKRWSFGAIPLIGQLVAADRDSYQYLVESIERFPGQEEFEGLIKEAGFMVPRDSGYDMDNGEEEGQGWENLTGGVACIHKGVKPIL